MFHESMIRRKEWITQFFGSFLIILIFSSSFFETEKLDFILWGVIGFDFLDSNYVKVTNKVTVENI